MNYGDGVRKSRKLIHAGMNTRHLQAYHEMHTTEARMFAKKLLDDPSKFLEHIRRYTLSYDCHAALTTYRTLTVSFLRFTYGHKVEDEHDTIIPLARKIVDIAGELISANRYAVDIFPICASICVQPIN